MRITDIFEAEQKFVKSRRTFTKREMDKVGPFPASITGAIWTPLAGGGRLHSSGWKIRGFPKHVEAAVEYAENKLRQADHIPT